MSTLRRARKARGWSQAEAARRAGLTQTILSAYERGAVVPPRQALERLMSAFGVTSPEELGYRWRAELAVEPIEEVPPCPS